MKKQDWYRSVFRQKDGPLASWLMGQLYPSFFQETPLDGPSVGSTGRCQDASLASMTGPPNGLEISPVLTPDLKLTLHVLSLGSQPPTSVGKWMVPAQCS